MDRKRLVFVGVLQAALASGCGSGAPVGGGSYFVGDVTSDIQLDTTDAATGCQGRYVDRLLDLGYPAAMVALPDGFAVVGHTSGASPSEAWLGRTDPQGNVLWHRTFGGATSDMGRDVLALSDGFAVAGQKGSDGWLLRTDLQGNLLWEKTFGGVGGTTFAAFVALADGFAIGGYGLGNAWLVRTDLAGSLIWQQTFGGPEQESVADVLALPDGFLLGGRTASKGAGETDAWLLRTDLQGNLLWDKTFGGVGNDLAVAVVALPDGFAVAAQTDSFQTGKSEAWLIRTDLAGNIVWDRRYGGDGTNVAAMVGVPDGFAIAGWRHGASNDAWLQRTDLQGNPSWSKTFDSGGNDTGRDLVALADGFALLGGPAARLRCTDAWGNVSCAEAGACAVIAAESCSDGNLCTVDSCDAEKGCTHDEREDGVACATGKTCTAGVCSK